MFDDIKACFERDPACRGISGFFQVIFLYSGYHAIKWHRLAHAFYRLGLRFLPRLISQFARFFTGIEIHPGAKIGKNCFIDHGMGVVIGETAELSDGCTLFQGVTLGGTGKAAGKRHPTLGRNVVVGVGAKVLGDITVGDDSYVGAGAVVLRDVPSDSTAVGVPARIVRQSGRRVRGADLDHTNLPDPILDRLQGLQEEIERAEAMIREERALPHRLLVMAVDDVLAGSHKLHGLLDKGEIAYRYDRREDGTARFELIVPDICASGVVTTLKAVPEFTVVSEGQEETMQPGALEAAPKDQPPEKQMVRLMILLRKA